MRISVAILIVSAFTTVAFATVHKSCSVHCGNSGDCGCDGTTETCQGVYCEHGCGIPCPTCTGSGITQGRKYGGCLYSTDIPASFRNTRCTGSGYCGYCDCTGVDGQATGLLDDCCRYDCSLCAVAGCPAERLTCEAQCVPNSDTDASNCCYCDCEDGDPCTANTWDAALQECTSGPACPPSTCNEPECIPNGNTFSCEDNLLSNTECVTEADKCKVGTCVSGVCLNPSDRDCSDNNDCTIDTCDPANGCGYDNVENGAECDDGSPCTGGDVCAQGVCRGPSICEGGETCTPSGCARSNFAIVGAGAAGAAVCAAVAAAGLLNRRGDEEDSESWAKMSSGSSYGNKRMTTATQMSSFTRGSGGGDRSSRGSRSSRSSKGKRMTGVTQMSGASRGEMMGLEGASSGSRATMGTTHSQMSRATRSTSGSRNSRSSRGSRSSKGRSHASGGTRSSGSRNSRSSRGRH